MTRPAAQAVCRQAVSAVRTGYTYDEMDCQAFVEHCVHQAGGRMAYRGSNDMARGMAYLAPLEEAKAAGKLVPGALLFIREADESRLPDRYRADGLGDFGHVGLYLGPDALTDRDKNGVSRACDAAHSSATMGRAAGSTLQNGWTHAGWAREIDYGSPAPASRAVVEAANGQPVRLRKSASLRERLYWMVAPGTAVTIERERGDWTLVIAPCTDGHTRRAYLQSRYLRREG